MLFLPDNYHEMEDGQDFFEFQVDNLCGNWMNFCFRVLL